MFDGLMLQIRRLRLIDGDFLIAPRMRTLSWASNLLPVARLSGVVGLTLRAWPDKQKMNRKLRAGDTIVQIIRCYRRWRWRQMIKAAEVARTPVESSEQNTTTLLLHV